MRRVFVHEASLAAQDEAAPGAAVTVELCGHWEHAGSCRWPHNTSVARRSERSVVIRTVFACEPAEAPALHGRIADALGRGRLEGPAGGTTWTVLGDGPAALDPSEAELGERLTRS